jgi:CRISPR-associated protein Cas5t
MIALGLTVPIACWRKGAARELLETEELPPPATCYGALLSLVGETDRERHRGCRVTVGLLRQEGYQPGRSTVLRTLWRIKDGKTLQGNKENARPDFQQLIIDARLAIWCDSAEEPEPSVGLEHRVRRAIQDPASVDRFGGWSLGESTHLINDVWLHESGHPPGVYSTYLLATSGDYTLPVWVDHVGSAGTRHVTGQLEETSTSPPRERLPQIPLASPVTAQPRAGGGKSGGKARA